MRRYVIIGAGITGLTLAYLLTKKYGENVQITILEEKSYPGGMMASKTVSGFSFDLGAKSFLTSGDGAFTLKLIDQLKLSSKILPCDQSAKKRFLRLNGKNHKINIPVLIKQGLLSSLIKDFFAPKANIDDETVLSFFSRHASSRFIKNILTPVTIGIRAGDPHYLSAAMAFPSLKEKEKKYGSLFRAMIANCFTQTLPRQALKTKTFLATLQGGLKTLIETLLTQIPPPIYDTIVTKIEACSLSSPAKVFTANSCYEADTVIYTGALPNLSSLISLKGLESLLQSTSYKRLSALSMGWNIPDLPRKKGYGMLVADEPPLLGIVWSTATFPSLSPGKSQMTCLFENNIPQEDAISIGTLAVSNYFGILQFPDAYAFLQEQLPQHGQGFQEHLNYFQRHLPPSIKILGQNVSGPGINRCIACAYQALDSL